MVPLKLHIIICGTRPGREVPSSTQWFFSLANDIASWISVLVDFAEVKLPVHDEPEHRVCSVIATNIRSVGRQALTRRTRMCWLPPSIILGRRHRC